LFFGQLVRILSLAELSVLLGALSLGIAHRRRVGDGLVQCLVEVRFLVELYLLTGRRGVVHVHRRWLFL
jgi:hypothetical protein